MAYEPGRGKTLLIPSGPAGKSHLFVTLTDGCKSGHHLLVPICSIVSGRYHDPACTLNGGEHKLITHGSYAEYRLARIETTEVIKLRVAQMYFMIKDDATARLLVQLEEGLPDSEQASKRIKDYFLKRQAFQARESVGRQRRVDLLSGVVVLRPAACHGAFLSL